MTMTTLLIPGDMSKRLEALAAQAHVPKDEYALQLLEEILEDQEDYLIALARSERREKGIDEARPFEELIEEYKREHGPNSLDN